MASDVYHETIPQTTIRTRLALSSLFRVIPAGEYLDYFASDRSHMVSRRLSAPQPLSPSDLSRRARAKCLVPGAVLQR